MNFSRPYQTEFCFPYIAFISFEKIADKQRRPKQFIMTKVLDFNIFQKNIILYYSQIKKVCSPILICSDLHVI